MIIDAHFSIVFFSYIALVPAVQTIHWNENWAFACDFSENNLKNIRVRGEDCGPQCSLTPDCTHFTWTQWQGGTCWMKKGGATKENAFETRDNSMVCGIIDRQSRTKNSGDIINRDVFACVFNGIDSSSIDRHFAGLQATGWKPTNKDEAAVFLAHVFHETNGLKTMTEYCAPGRFLHFLFHSIL